MDDRGIRKLLVSSKEFKSRLKWSHELHNRFIDAVNQLGGPHKATPKSLMRVMEIPGLTLYHLKSHLQKYRKRQGFGDNKRAENLEAGDVTVNEEKDDETKEILQIKEELQTQVEVQKQLHQEIEVQRNLQVRIEAEGKYLDSVLMKAQETLSGYTSWTLGINRSCVNSSFSGLTQDEEEDKKRFLESKKPENRGIRQARSSVDSSLTSLESSEIEMVTEEVKRRSWNDAVCVQEPPNQRLELGLSLNSFKDMETCSNTGLGLN